MLAAAVRNAVAEVHALARKRSEAKELIRPSRYLPAASDAE
jgi:hypothetical protein